MHRQQLVTDSRGDEWFLNVTGPLFATMGRGSVYEIWLGRFQLKQNVDVRIVVEASCADVSALKALLEQHEKWIAQRWKRQRSRSAPAD